MKYCSPKSGNSLYEENGKLTTKDGTENYTIYENGIVDFMKCESEEYKKLDNNQLYGSDELIVRYDNFLEWLFKTFKTTPKNFRKSNALNLDIKVGSSVLVTACGVGGDINEILKIVGETGKIYAQDLSMDMIVEARRRVTETNVYFSISDATNLPFNDSTFDACFHFGGINLFSDINKAINEMIRVTKNDGVVMFGDESVAPWHRKTDYGKAMIFNNSLWSAAVPMNSIPKNIKDFSLKYVLGDCFYMIKLRTRKEKNELADLTIPHIGHRGGSIFSRYFGKLEGINPSVQQALDLYTKKNNLQLSSVIEDAIVKYINEQSK
jgi:ubiquinone/menaquinone biosynthesis C-methylase UbiE